MYYITFNFYDHDCILSALNESLKATERMRLILDTTQKKYLKDFYRIPNLFSYFQLSSVKKYSTDN